MKPDTRIPDLIANVATVVGFFLLLFSLFFWGREVIQALNSAMGTLTKPVKDSET